MTTVLLALGAWLLLDIVLVGGYLLWRAWAVRRRAQAAPVRPVLRLVREDDVAAPAGSADVRRAVDLDRAG
ncbi:hypothetical protein [Patulibacter sp. SYSU D01012]|uniref:hypothetical protein n=1 Tax=Patulibacter sp. SYSU D01012 TaxID=2817381 RepID=UPI001B3061C3|nr:hypothetical protein [Patulibacter sp. SYSU D01012]